MCVRVIWLACGAGVCLLPDCRAPARTAPPAEPTAEEATDSQPESAPVAEPPPTRVDIEFELEDPNRWLTVEKIRGDAPGAWATASFDPTRNKFTIETQDVAEFTIDTSRVPVRWDRLVIIRIDGSNSELVKRDYSLYRFTRDEHGQWVVVEP